MTPSLPFRSRARNTACATAAPAVLFLVASRCTGSRDRAEILLRGDLEAMTTAQARSHAFHVLDTLCALHIGTFIDVQVVTSDNVLVVAIGGAVA